MTRRTIKSLATSVRLSILAFIDNQAPSLTTFGNGTICFTASYRLIRDRRHSQRHLLTPSYQSHRSYLADDLARPRSTRRSPLKKPRIRRILGSVHPSFRVVKSAEKSPIFKAFGRFSGPFWQCNFRPWIRPFPRVLSNDFFDIFCLVSAPVCGPDGGTFNGKSSGIRRRRYSNSERP